MNQHGAHDEPELSARLDEHSDAVVNELERRVLADVRWPYATVDDPAAYRAVVQMTIRKFLDILADGDGPLWERLAPERVLLAERLPASIRDLVRTPDAFVELYESDRDLVQDFAYMVYDEILDVPPSGRNAFAEHCLEWAKTKSGLAAVVERWKAELAEDEVLAAEVFEALPAEARRKCDEARERSKVPLRVTVPDAWWRCDACSKAFDAREVAVVINGERDELTFCPACVGRVATELGGAGRPDHDGSGR